MFKSNTMLLCVLLSTCLNKVSEKLKQLKCLITYDYITYVANRLTCFLISVAVMRAHVNSTVEEAGPAMKTCLSNTGDRDGEKRRPVRTRQRIRHE